MCLIGPRGSDKYNPRDLQLLLWISMLIGFQLDLTDLASPWTASSQGVGVYTRQIERKKGKGGRKGKKVYKGSNGRAVWRSMEDIPN